MEVYRVDKIQLTKKQLQELEERIAEIENTEIPNNSLEIERAKEFGDLSENAEYHSAKEYHSKLFEELSQLKDKFSKATIIKQSSDTNTVKIGHFVTLECTDSKEILSFQLIGESGNGVDSIDANSKLGSNILNKQVDDIISFDANNPSLGTLSYKINSIKN